MEKLHNKELHDLYPSVKSRRGACESYGDKRITKDFDEETSRRATSSNTLA